MIKFKGENPVTKKAFFGFGLSDENITELRKGRPIYIDGIKIESVYNYFIFYGKTEEQMYDTLKSFINKDTKLNIEK